MLDIVGDLSLVGKPIRGHLIAVKPGHATNCEFAKLIVAQMNKPRRAAQAFGPPPAGGNGAEKKEASPVGRREVALTTEQVQQLLPHRYPMLMVDCITKLEATRIEAVKNVSSNEPYFQGHFPNHP